METSAGLMDRDGWYIPIRLLLFGGSIGFAVLIPIPINYWGVPFWDLVGIIAGYWTPVLILTNVIFGGLTKSEIEEEIDDELDEDNDRFHAEGLSGRHRGPDRTSPRGIGPPKETPR